MSSTIFILVEKLAEKYVKFPNEQQISALRVKFFDMCGIRGAFGAIDGTHIAIAAPSGPNYSEHLYVNRKGYHSINVQLICDADGLIINVNARYPGSTHDAFIWNHSMIKNHLHRKYESGNFNSFLLGDSGYPLQPYCLIPYPERTVVEREIAFNRAHKKGRAIIERLNGRLKSRFRCLLRHRTLHYHPERAAKIIVACCVLHNICILAGVEDEDESINVDDEVPIEVYGNPQEPAYRQGAIIRNMVADNLA